MEIVQHAKRLLLCRLHFVRCVKSDILQEMHELRPYDIVHCVFKYAGIVIHPCHMALIEAARRFIAERGVGGFTLVDAATPGEHAARGIPAGVSARLRRPDPRWTGRDQGAKTLPGLRMPVGSNTCVICRCNSH